MANQRFVRGTRHALLLALISVSLAMNATAAETGATGQQWSAERANAWYAQQPWFAGANFVPSTAINQLEMWQADTFDSETIDRELGWAEGIGFNAMRVYLHDLLWEQDSEGFLNRMDAYLAIADRHGIRTMFVLFDSVWDPFPKLGPQRDPKPGIHNSGWVQGPHIELLKDPERHAEVKPYVIGVLTRFRDDSRVLAWDLLNEPGNRAFPYFADDPLNKMEICEVFLTKLFAWSREVDPSQPLTAGIWQQPGVRTDPPHPLDQLMLDHSDIITFHAYTPLDGTKTAVEWLQTFGRPVICTEYMARSAGSTFEAIMPFFKEQNVGAINWGLVNGRSQTIYPWGSWGRPHTSEPEVWFHDVFRADGTPFSQEEADLIRSLTDRE